MPNVNHLVARYNEACQESRIPLIYRNRDELYVRRGGKRAREGQGQIELVREFLERYGRELNPGKYEGHRQFLEHLQGRVKRIKTDVEAISRRVEGILREGDDEERMAVDEQANREIDPARLPYPPEERVFSDVTFRVGEDKLLIPCHRVILAHDSPFFQAMLQGGFREGRELVVSLEDVEEEAFLQYLQYAYQKRLPKDFSSLVMLGALGDYFSHSVLTSKVVDEVVRLLRSLTDEDERREMAAPLFAALDGVPIPKALEAALLPALVDQDPKNLSRQCMQMLLEADFLPRITEAALYDRLCEWEEARLQPGQDFGSLIFEKQSDGKCLADFIRFEWMPEHKPLEVVLEGPTRPRRDRSFTYVVQSETKEGETLAVLKGWFKVNEGLPAVGPQPFSYHGSRRIYQTLSLCGYPFRIMLDIDGWRDNRFFTMSLSKKKGDRDLEVSWKLAMPYRNRDMVYTGDWVDYATNGKLPEKKLNRILVNGSLPFWLFIKAKRKSQQ